MTCIYFHTEHGGEAQLQGSEREWLGWISTSPAAALWDLGSSSSCQKAVEIMKMVDRTSPDDVVADLVTGFDQAHREQTANALLWDQYRADLQRDPTMERLARWPQGLTYEAQRLAVSMLKLAMGLSPGVPFKVAGVRLSSRAAERNTALRIGSPALALAAKISGWCEQHCWVDGPDRAWLADIIDSAISQGIYREGMWVESAGGAESNWRLQGWREVTALLRAAAAGPVVLSYSVTFGFPNHRVAGWPDDADGDMPQAWQTLPAERQWEQAMNGLRTMQPWAQISPDSLHEATFGPPVTVFDLLAPDRDKRVLAAAAAAAGTAPRRQGRRRCVP